METAHLQRGFSEIAQNLTTFPDGTIALCRSIDTMPAGIKGANKNGICVENVGNFDLGQDAMTPKQRDCIIHSFALLCKKFSLHPDSANVVYHVEERADAVEQRNECDWGSAVSFRSGTSKRHSDSPQDIRRWKAESLLPREPAGRKPRPRAEMQCLKSEQFRRALVAGLRRHNVLGGQR
jgi:hypothetical protein